MAQIDEILTQVKMLNLKLYGENGFEGDIPEIKSILKEHSTHFDDHSKRITILEVKQRERNNRSKREIGATGGIGAIIGVVVATIADYFMRRSGG